LEKVRKNCFLNFQTSSPVQKVKKKEKALVARSKKEFLVKTTENKGCENEQYAEYKKPFRKTLFHQKKRKKS
jgi:hypothetical protein